MPSPDALARAIASLPPPTTLPALRDLQALLELRTLRAALEAVDWLPEAAARRLGAEHGSSIQRAVARHPELVAELKRRRQVRTGVRAQLRSA